MRAPTRLSILLVMSAAVTWAAVAAPTTPQNAQPDPALTAPPPQDSNISVKPLPPTSPQDEAIAARVRAKLAADSQLDNSDITISSNSAVITLTGHASSTDARSEATVAAEAVDGVRSVFNQLAVSPTAAAVGAQIDRAEAHTAQGASDLWLTAKVKAAVLSESQAYGDVTVSVHSGIVALGGTLDNPRYAIPRLKAMIANIDGVRGVDSSALEGGAK